MRRPLDLPQRAATATVLAEAGQLPLYITWLMAAARLWSTVVAAAQCNIMQ